MDRAGLTAAGSTNGRPGVLRGAVDQVGVVDGVRWRAGPPGPAAATVESPRRARVVDHRYGRGMSGSALIMYATSNDGITLRAALSGELDLADADEVRDNLAAAASASTYQFLQIDVSDVTLIDSYALGALVSVRNSAAAAGVTVTLVNPSPPVLKAIQVTGLAEVFGLP
ncbi:STAS domain-containing protein [Actinoplanes philippinensis]|uniref:STAS domain-containing protein n=1 Tax=Actinoplanes philippinensis TaxID=35752 RepID=UPI0033D771F4